MSCTNCFNGCSEINSDQCIKYTGIDIPGLGITNGDTLLSIEEKIFNYIQSFMVGEEIFPTIDPLIICNIIDNNLPVCTGCTGISLNDILTAIIKSICELDVEITSINNQLSILNADYTIGCLTGVTASSDTHAIVQAVINNLCTLNSAVSALALSLNNYVLLSEFDSLVENYLSTTPSEQLISNRMVPYSAVPYFPPGGSLANFDGSGGGLGIWDRIYLCNGENFTPDLRGRVLVEVTAGIPGGAFDPEVNPATPGNPNYDFGSVQTFGANQITLTENQIPSHTHIATVTETPHIHQVGPDTLGVLSPLPVGTGTVAFNPTTNYDLQSTFFTEPSSTGLTVTNAVAGGNLAHSNIQPVFACYYIMYIPV